MTAIKLPPIPEYFDAYVCDDMLEYGLVVAQTVRAACAERGMEAEYSSADAVRATILSIKIEGENDADR